METQSEDPMVHEASLIIDEAWSELQQSLYVQSQRGSTLTRFPDVSFEEAERRSGVGRSLLKRLEGLDRADLPHELALTLRLVRFRARTWAREADWYWKVIDPLGIGLFGMFLPTAYCGGYLLNFANRIFTSFLFHESGDADRYLGLISDYGRLVQQFANRTIGQSQRGIRMPRAQITQARALLTALKSSARAQVAVRAQRDGASWPTGFARKVKRCIAESVEPAFDGALAALSDQYAKDAPEAVGIGQYPGGAELYSELVKLHTTLDMSPQQVHAYGLERMAKIEESIRAIQGEIGFEGDRAEFTAYMNRSPEWRASTIDGVVAVFQRYIDRLKPHLQKSFQILPRAAYGVAPLPDALQGSMTYGYYDPPNRNQAEGIYRFNAAHLTEQPLFHVGALIYHELMPGHHLQFAIQQENATLHPFRAHSFVNAYCEGWAEYAATWTGEIGLYEAPQELYGRLLSDAFLTTRLVVDTGMNFLGWSLERGREYMRTHSRITESEIRTESIRYSCDIPAQALAYKLGDAQMLAMRERMRRALGARFTLKDFHTAILSPGALPLSDLEWHIEHEIQNFTKCSAQ